jgi:hypothetical protein
MMGNKAKVKEELSDMNISEQQNSFNNLKFLFLTT